MRNFMLIIRNPALVLCCLTALLLGCGETQNETTTKPKVVSQKISIEKKTGTTPADKTHVATTADASKSGKTPEKEAAESTGATTDTGKTAQTVSASAQAADTGMPADSELKPKKRAGAMVDTLTGESSLKMITYVPDGKIDPFLPLFREEPDAKKEEKKGTGKAEDKKKVKKSPRRLPRTPLEKMDVSQLKLVGIIRSGGGNKALVQDASGKGYVLNKGTFIGANSGFVTQITKNKVIIEEEEDDETIDTDGLVTIRQRELVLQKPVGEI